MKKNFPVVMKGRNGHLVVIYKNRVELYEFKLSETKADIDKSNGEDCTYNYEKIYGKGWNAWHEIEMNKNNGFKEIHSVQDEEN